MLDDVGENTDRIFAFLSSLATVITAPGWFLERVSRRRKKQINYRVHWNGSITHPEGGDVASDLEVRYRNETVVKPEIAVLRLEKTGSNLSAEELTEKPIEFTFGGRQIVTAVVANTRPKKLARSFLDINDRIEDDRLELTPVVLKNGHRLKLPVVLSGDHGEVGHLWGGGTLIAEEPRVRRSRLALILGGATLALLGLTIGLIIVPGRTTPAPVVAVACHNGTVTVDGSTALRPALTRLAAVYIGRCEAAHPGVKPQIVVNESSSGEALRTLVKLGTESTDQAARRNRRLCVEIGASDPR